MNCPVEKILFIGEEEFRSQNSGVKVTAYHRDKWELWLLEVIIADFGFLIADCRLRIFDCGLRILH